MRTMKIPWTLVFVVVHYATTAVTGARILAIESYGSKSHWQYMTSILDLLTARHQVTAITPLPKGNRENYTEIDASSVFPIYGEMSTVMMIEQFGSVVNMLPLMPERSHERDICDKLFEFQPVKDLLLRVAADHDYRPFDLVLLEPFYSPCLSYLARQLRVPEIYVMPSSMISPMEVLMFGTEPSPSYVPNLMFKGGIPKSVTQRVTNVLLYAYVKFVPWLTEIRMMYGDPKPYDTVRHKPSLVFINTHFITERPRPFPVNMIQVGGIHLKPPQALPNDILKFIDNSPHGVIFFTFGSVASMSSLPKHIQKAFIEAFAQIPQRVLWKYDGEIEDLPDNIMIKKWFPQRDILLHPNVRLFMSHGGISGVYEAVDAGVLVLGFPLFFDQPRNVGNLVDAGMALSMDLLTVTKDALLRTIKELLENEKYTRNAKFISTCFKDRPLSPNESIVYWTEYVLRHNGSYHIISEALNLTWYQYLLLDVMIVLIFCLLAPLYLTYFIFKTLKKIYF